MQRCRKKLPWMCAVFGASRKRYGATICTSSAVTFLFGVFRYSFVEIFTFLTLCSPQKSTLTLQRGLQRGLQRIFDIFNPETDVCKNGEGDYGVCDQSRFPRCVTGQTLICYNRRPMREFFYPDTRQPYFYIDYDSVFCYPDTWGGCSSCSPGRYCSSEDRCILDEQNYNCEQWI